MTRESREQTTENESKSSDELLELKKELANKIIDKLLAEDPDLLSIISPETASNFLINDGSFKDNFRDEVILWHFWKSLWLTSDKLNGYRKKLNNVETKENLKELENEIFNWESYQTIPSSTKPSDSARSTTSSTSSTTSTDPEISTTEKAQVETWESLALSNIKFTISPESKKIRESLKWKNKPDLEPFACALKAYNTVKKQGLLHNTKYLTIVDFSKKKWKKRFFVINMENNTVEHAVKVWHWKKSGGERAKLFSNNSGDNTSSLGWYILPNEITKSPTKGWYWLRRITWLESSNNNAANRWIAVHEGWENGSAWCFTLPKDVSKTIMKKIKWWFLFAYAKSREYFAQSKYFKQDSNGNFLA